MKENPVLRSKKENLKRALEKYESVPEEVQQSMITKLELLEELRILGFAIIRDSPSPKQHRKERERDGKRADNNPLAQGVEGKSPEGSG